MKIIPLVVAAFLLAAPSPALASPDKPLPAQSCNGTAPNKDVHGANRPCSQPAAPAPAAPAPAAPAADPAPVSALAVVSVVAGGAPGGAYALRATSPGAVTYASITWRNAVGRSASCIVQTPYAGTRADGVYACTPATAVGVLSGTYSIHAVYVADATQRRIYSATQAAQAGLSATFTR